MVTPVILEYQLPCRKAQPDTEGIETNQCTDRAPPHSACRKAQPDTEGIETVALCDYFLRFFAKPSSQSPARYRGHRNYLNWL